MGMWMFGTGWPKGQEAGKALDKKKGRSRKVVGSYGWPRINSTVYKRCCWHLFVFSRRRRKRKRGTDTGPRLNQLYEPILLCRCPLNGTLAENILLYNTGGFNLTPCRIGTDQVLCQGRKRFNLLHGKVKAPEGLTTLSTRIALDVSRLI